MNANSKQGQSTLPSSSHSSNGPDSTSNGSPIDPDFLDKVQRLFSENSSDFRTTLIKEMLTGIVKLHEMDVDILDIKILHRAFKELRHAFGVFQPYAHIRKVSIFGSARTPPEDPNFQLAVRFGRLLSENEYMVITGAGEGIMWAGHEGAGKDHSFGVNIMLPFETTANPVILDDPKLVHLKYFFTRKLLFVRQSHATALFPGGFGTLDEGYELLTLIQTGKANPVPIVCLHAPGSGYWDRWLEFNRKELLPRKLICEADLSLFKVFENEHDAFEEIQQFYRNYHSIRFIGDKFLIRLQDSLTDTQLQHVNKEFRGLIVDGDITQCGPFPEEVDEPELASLTRLVFHYTRRDAGRLRQLIDYLNAAPVDHSALPQVSSA